MARSAVSYPIRLRKLIKEFHALDKYMGGKLEKIAVYPKDYDALAGIHKPNPGGFILMPWFGNRQLEVKRLHNDSQ